MKTLAYKSFVLFVAAIIGFAVRALAQEVVIDGVPVEAQDATDWSYGIWCG